MALDRKSPFLSEYIYHEVNVVFVFNTAFKKMFSLTFQLSRVLLYMEEKKNVNHLIKDTQKNTEEYISVLNQQRWRKIIQTFCDILWLFSYNIYLYDLEFIFYDFIKGQFVKQLTPRRSRRSQISLFHCEQIIFSFSLW